jgi:crotonobetainyl-CoA:carnitine CoA-transferase CaiB-like acyl-CoA transferase
MLSESGAEVVKLALDWKTEPGKAELLTLAERADVMMESFRPGVMERFGLGFDEVLQPLNERLIYVSITGYGRDGPYAAMAGHDINYLAMNGVLDLIGAPDGPPVIPGVQLADLAGGSMQAVTGILLALEARHRTGRGQRVTISMTEGSAMLLAIPMAEFKATGRVSKRGAEMLSGRYACYNVYLCRDGRWVAVGALERKFWVNLCRELGCEECVELQFAEEQSSVKARLSGIFRARAAEEWFELLKDKDCCVTPVRTLAEYHNRESGQAETPTLPSRGRG